MEIRQNVIDDLNAMTTESWRTIRIMAEMVQALDTLNKLGTNCVSIFGSARSTSDTPEYRDAERLARCWWKRASASSPAAAPASWSGQQWALPRRRRFRGPAHRAAPRTGLQPVCEDALQFPLLLHPQVHVREVRMAYVVMPGGMGTIDELSEAFVLAQTGRIRPFPIILYNSSYWAGLLEWLRTSMANGGFINREEIDKLVTVCDTPEQVVEHLCKIVIL